MLLLEDRLRVALGAGLGVQLQSGDVEIVTRMLVVLRQIESQGDQRSRALAATALKPFEDRIA